MHTVAAEDISLTTEDIALLKRHKAHIYSFIDAVFETRASQGFGYLSFWVGRQSNYHIGSRASTSTMPLLNRQVLKNLKGTDAFSSDLSQDDIENIRLTLMGICKEKEGEDLEFGLYKAARSVITKDRGLSNNYSAFVNDILIGIFKYRDIEPNWSRRVLSFFGMRVDLTEDYANGEASRVSSTSADNSASTTAA